MGDALLQKTYTVDFLTKKRVANNGIVPQYYVENNHEAIIPREIYMKVQEEMVRRTNISEKDGKRRVYSGKLALSSIVFCGECGEINCRVYWNNRGCKSIVWHCVSRLEGNGLGCLSPTVCEETLLEAINQAINDTLGNKAEFLEKMKYNV